MDAELLVACVVLAGATYLVRLAGVTMGQQDNFPESADRTVDAAIAVLLAAVAATSTLYDGQQLADWPRMAGVLAGALAAVLRLPLIAVLLAAGGTAGALRLLS
ncbi:AzlD domain-containing protein [Arthrobacter sp. Sa2BUA2]|uniref:AzlD domain-containing protein n=1 Tax=Arthrobacter pullicola TaxID=2762224 RepID=A0ABR8YJQ8_9MICC|nr:AzlD domain-containing protein [Arthrobacter pullicola]MBD8044476.1 AzlD domain-containing protein [Arthrobacter pullicola]